MLSLYMATQVQSPASLSHHQGHTKRDIPEHHCVTQLLTLPKESGYVWSSKENENKMKIQKYRKKILPQHTASTL